MQELRIRHKSVLCFLVWEPDGGVLLLKVVVYSSQNLRHDKLNKPFVSLVLAGQRSDTDFYDGNRQITGQQFVKCNGFFDKNFHIIVDPRVCGRDIPVY